jgi:myosin I
VCFNSDHLLLKQCFQDGKPDVEEKVDNRVKRMSSEFSNKKRPPTAVAQFKSSLANLMENLLSKTPHYIRCVKPNESKSAWIFDERLCRHQARYLGLLENVRVRRAGYAFRQEYGQFFERCVTRRFGV